LCRNLCPLEAHLLNQVVRRMPPARRPVILTVSVDVYADTRADLLQDARRWELVPQWHWAVGRPAQLAAVCKRYEISVSVATQRIGSTFIHDITHTEGAYIIDATRQSGRCSCGPSTPQDVKRALQHLS
jgi:cytochrome oxidase Cu insertion factor (SCO1/SenC/PrrC family)